MKIEPIETTKELSRYSVTVADDSLVFGTRTYQVDVDASGPLVWNPIERLHTQCHTLTESQLAAIADRFARDAAALAAEEARLAHIAKLAESLEIMRVSAESAAWERRADAPSFIASYRAALTSYTLLAARWYVGTDPTPYPTEAEALRHAYPDDGKWDGQIVRARAEWDGPIPKDLRLPA